MADSTHDELSYVVDAAVWQGCATNGLPVTVPDEMMSVLRARAEQERDEPTQRVLMDPDVWLAFFRGLRDMGLTRTGDAGEPGAAVVWVPPDQDTMYQFVAGRAHVEPPPAP